MTTQTNQQYETTLRYFTLHGCSTQTPEEMTDDNGQTWVWSGYVAPEAHRVTILHYWEGSTFDWQEIGSFHSLAEAKRNAEMHIAALERTQASDPRLIVDYSIKSWYGEPKHNGVHYQWCDKGCDLQHDWIETHCDPAVADIDASYELDNGKSEAERRATKQATLSKYIATWDVALKPYLSTNAWLLALGNLLPASHYLSEKELDRNINAVEKALDVAETLCLSRWAKIHGEQRAYNKKTRSYASGWYDLTLKHRRADLYDALLEIAAI